MSQQPEFAEAFRKIATEEAARDERLCKITRWLLIGNKDLLNDLQQEMWVDVEFTAEDIATRYEISLEDARLAMEKAEERIFEEVHHEQTNQ